MKIHITGGDGYIGRNIFESLRTKHQISRSDIQNLDVLNKDLLIEYFKENTPEIIIHLAGLMGARQSKLDLYKTFSVNSFGLLNVLEAARIVGIKNIIFFSSFTVHGSNQDEKKMINEGDIFMPGHSYATSKIIGEYVIKDYSRFNNMNVIILRPTIVVGNLSGEENALNEFTRNAFNDEPIVIYGDGKHKREFISISDLVNSVEKSIDYLEKYRDKIICETFIISSGKPISMAELAIKCVNKTGRGNVQHIEKSTQAFSLFSNISKAKDQLKWEPEDDINTMIENVLNILKVGKNDHK